MSSKPISAARRQSTFANASPRAARRRPTRQAAGLYSVRMDLTFPLEVLVRMGLTFERAKGRRVRQLTPARRKVTGEKPGGRPAKRKPSIRRLVKTGKVATSQSKAGKSMSARFLGTRRKAIFVPRRKSQVRIVGA